MSRCIPFHASLALAGLLALAGGQAQAVMPPHAEAQAAQERLAKAAKERAQSTDVLKLEIGEVSRLGTLTDPNLNVAAKLENLKSGALLGDEGAAAKVNEWVGKLQDQIAEGVDASVLTASIRQMRDEASQLFKSGKAGAKITPEETAMAQAKFGAASALEDLLAQNIQDKTLLDRFKKAREFNARSYDYERSTNLATGQVDPSALAALPHLQSLRLSSDQSRWPCARFRSIAQQVDPARARARELRRHPPCWRARWPNVTPSRHRLANKARWPNSRTA